MRRNIALMIMSLLLVLNLGNRAAAAQLMGSIRVTLGMQEGEVALYYVGERIEGGYVLRDPYGGGFIKEEDAHSPALAQWLAESVDGEGRYRTLDAEGTAEFSQVSQGLYLLVQTETQRGYYPITPFLITLPYEGQWNIHANPKSQQSPHTGQNLVPFLGAAGMVLSGAGLLGCFVKKKRT